MLNGKVNEGDDGVCKMEKGLNLCARNRKGESCKSSQKSGAVPALIIFLSVHNAAQSTAIE